MNEDEGENPFQTKLYIHVQASKQVTIEFQNCIRILLFLDLFSMIELELSSYFI